MTAKQKQNRERFKKVIAEAQKLRKKNPKLTQPQAVKQAWEIMYGKTDTAKKVGAVKRKPVTKVKASKSKKTGQIHTDTKSHNVNIRVVSGIDNVEYLKKHIERKEYFEKLLAKYKSIPVKERTTEIKNLVKVLPNIVKQEKQIITLYKKTIK